VQSAKSADFFVASPLKYVYLLRSIRHPEQRYVGVTFDLETLLPLQRGPIAHISTYRPWALVTYICFAGDLNTASVRLTSSAI
jgi:hypothetical protein